MATANGKEGGFGLLRSYMRLVRRDPAQLATFKRNYREDVNGVRTLWQTNPLEANRAAVTAYATAQGLTTDDITRLDSMIEKRSEKYSDRPAQSRGRRVSGPDVTFTNITDGTDQQKRLWAEAETASALYVLGLPETEARKLAHFQSDQDYGNVQDLMAQWRAQQDQSNGGQK